MSAKGGVEGGQSNHVFSNSKQHTQQHTTQQHTTQHETRSLSRATTHSPNNNNKKKTRLGERGAAANSAFTTSQASLASSRDSLLTLNTVTLPSSLSSLGSLASSTQASLTSSSLALAEARQDVERKLAKLQEGMGRYEATGLSFERAGGNRLRLVFTLVDPKDEGREFCFTLNVNEENKYEVCECEPGVGGVEGLLRKVNEDNEFGAFVKAMRKEFVKTV